MLDLDSIDENEVDLRIDRQLNPDASLAGADKRQGARLLDETDHSLDPALRFATRDEIPQAFDDLTRTQCLFGALAQGLLNSRDRRLTAASPGDVWIPSDNC